jgi:hypothetical protein
VARLCAQPAQPAIFAFCAFCAPGLVEKLEGGSRLRGFGAAVRNAQKFKKMSKMTWRSMISDGLAMRHGRELTGSPVVMAANTSMLLKGGLRSSISVDMKL